MHSTVYAAKKGLPVPSIIARKASAAESVMSSTPAPIQPPVASALIEDADGELHTHRSGEPLESIEIRVLVPSHIPGTSRFTSPPVARLPRQSVGVPAVAAGGPDGMTVQDRLSSWRRTRHAAIDEDMASGVVALEQRVAELQGLSLQWSARLQAKRDDLEDHKRQLAVWEGMLAQNFAAVAAAAAAGGAGAPGEGGNSRAGSPARGPGDASGTFSAPTPPESRQGSRPPTAFAPRDKDAAAAAAAAERSGAVGRAALAAEFVARAASGGPHLSGNGGFKFWDARADLHGAMAVVIADMGAAERGMLEAAHREVEKTVSLQHMVGFARTRAELQAEDTRGLQAEYDVITARQATLGKAATAIHREAGKLGLDAEALRGRLAAKAEERAHVLSRRREEWAARSETSRRRQAAIDAAAAEAARKAEAARLARTPRGLRDRMNEYIVKRLQVNAEMVHDERLGTFREYQRYAQLCTLTEATSPEDIISSFRALRRSSTAAGDAIAEREALRDFLKLRILVYAEELQSILTDDRSPYLAFMPRPPDSATAVTPLHDESKLERALIDAERLLVGLAQVGRAEIASAAGAQAGLAALARRISRELDLLGPPPESVETGPSVTGGAGASASGTGATPAALSWLHALTPYEGSLGGPPPLPPPPVPPPPPLVLPPPRVSPPPSPAPPSLAGHSTPGHHGVLIHHGTSPHNPGGATPGGRHATFVDGDDAGGHSGGHVSHALHISGGSHDGHSRRGSAAPSRGVTPVPGEEPTLLKRQSMDVGLVPAATVALSRLYSDGPGGSLAPGAGSGAGAAGGSRRGSSVQTRGTLIPLSPSPAAVPASAAAAASALMARRAAGTWPLRPNPGYEPPDRSHPAIKSLEDFAAKLVAFMSRKSVDVTKGYIIHGDAESRRMHLLKGGWAPADIEQLLRSRAHSSVAMLFGAPDVESSSSSGGSPEGSDTEFGGGGRPTLLGGDLGGHRSSFRLSGSSGRASPAGSASGRPSAVGRTSFKAGTAGSGGDGRSFRASGSSSIRSSLGARVSSPRASQGLTWEASDDDVLGTPKRALSRVSSTTKPDGLTRSGSSKGPGDGSHGVIGRSPSRKAHGDASRD